MAKRIVLSVTCQDEFTDGAPELFVVELSPQQIDRMQSLAQSVSQLGVRAIEDFFYDGAWLSGTLDELDEIVTESTNGCLDKIAELKSAIEIPMMRITETAVYFTAYPEHASDGCKLSATSVPMSELKNLDPFVSVFG